MEKQLLKLELERKKTYCCRAVHQLIALRSFAILGICLVGGAGEASRVRIRCAWKKFRELSPILTARGASLALKGKIYSACIRSSMIYGSETWPMKVEDTQRLERAERMMVRHMCSYIEGQEVKRGVETAAWDR